MFKGGFHDARQETPTTRLERYFIPASPATPISAVQSTYQ